ncbi:O-antigen biosynthesis glycosyltransferase WbnK [subsurface metagenome]
MIISNIIGGLGNQLFMYAAGRRLAQKHNTILKLDISGYSYVEPSLEYNRYKLKHFNIIEGIATSEEIENIRGGKSRLNKTLGKYLPKRMLPALKVSYVRERKTQFDPDILNLPDDIYLEGYWQSEKYFMDIREILLNEITLKKGSDGMDNIIEEINEVNSVAIHVRRENFVTDPEVNRILGAMDLDYYQRCMEYFVNSINSPRFYVFTDDIGWAESNINSDYPVRIVSNPNKFKDYEEQYLMSLCKHQIIPNSTFSWWGAWLNRNPDKIICAPKMWYRSSSRSSKDLIPKEWKRF